MRGSECNMVSMMGFGWGLWMMLFWIIIIGLVIYTVFYLITNSNKENKDSSIEILKERFARGEIDQNEFEQKRASILNKKKP